MPTKTFEYKDQPATTRDWDDEEYDFDLEPESTLNPQLRIRGLVSIRYDKIIKISAKIQACKAQNDNHASYHIFKPFGDTSSYIPTNVWTNPNKSPDLTGADITTTYTTIAAWKDSEIDRSKIKGGFNFSATWGANFEVRKRWTSTGVVKVSTMYITVKISNFTANGTYNPQVTITFNEKGGITNDITADQGDIVTVDPEEEYPSETFTSDPIKYTLNAYRNYKSSDNTIVKTTSTTKTVDTTKNYRFIGWKDYRTRDIKFEISKTIDADYELINSESTVTWDPSSTLQIPGPLTREGYGFQGWWTRRTGGNKQVNDIVNPNSSFDLYAQWTAKKTTVNFNGNGGFVGIGGNWLSKDSKTATYDSQFTFPKWSITKDSYDNKTKKSKKQSTKKWTVKFYSNIPNSSSVDVSKIETAEAKYTEEYELKYWQCDSDSKMQYGDQEKINEWKDQSKSLDFTAIYTKKLSKVIENNGVGVPDLKNPVGYTFDSWYTAPGEDGSKVTITNGQFIPNFDKYFDKNEIKLYAHWTPIYRKLVFYYYTNTVDDKIPGSAKKRTHEISYNIGEKAFSVSVPNKDDKWNSPEWIYSPDVKFLGWAGATSEPRKWTDNKGVFNRSSDAPDCELILNFNPKENFKNYKDWGQYDYDSKENVGKINPSIDTTQYYYGCWIASGKYVKVNGDWKQVNAVYVNVNGIWKEVDDMKVNVNGNWKKEVGKIA